MATVRRSRGKWVADYRDHHGKRRIEGPKGQFENKAQEKKAAQALLTQRLSEVSRGDFQPHRTRPTFPQVCERYLEGKVNIRPSTRRGYECLIGLYLSPYFEGWKVTDISTSDLERFRSELAEGLPAPIVEAFVRRETAARPRLVAARAKQRAAKKKPGVRTINKCLTLLTMIFNYAHKHGWVERNPAEHVEKLRDAGAHERRPLDTNILTPDEVRLLIDAGEPAHRDKHGVTTSTNYRLIIKVAIFTGLRAGEMTGLQWGDIDWHSRQLHVRRAWKEGAYHMPKTLTSTRRVDLPKLLIDELREWQLACPKGADGLVFPNLEGKPMSHANLLQRGFYPALRRARLRKIRFHDLRHTFASLLLANGEDVVRVSRLLGHASPSITLNVYSHMLPKEHYGGTDRLAELIYGGNKVETLPKKTPSEGARPISKLPINHLLRVVAGVGIEPTTRGFSIRCSTN